MVCDICGENEAIIHVQQIMGGDILEIHMCAQCARKKGVALDKDGNGEFSLSKLLSGLVESFSQDEQMQPVEECPNCGTTLSDLQGSERAGCPECYSVFRSAIEDILNEYTDKIVHKGRYPEKLKAYKAILIDKEVLKRKLTEAVRKEEYETAARLRDRITELEKNPKKDAGEYDVQP